jgi:hypothetical protein
MPLVPPARMNHVRARQILVNKYLQEKRFYAIYRIADSGQCLLTRIEKTNDDKFHLSNIPVYYEKGMVVIGKDKSLSAIAWDSYLFELLLDDTLLGEFDL